MANVAIAGFQPESRGGCTPEMIRKRVLTNNTTAIFKGDALDGAAGGDVIVTATTNAAVYSVQWGGASYVSGGDRIERKYLPATTLYTSTGIDPGNASYVYCVANMQSQVFLASVDAAIALTDLNLNYIMTLGTGNTTTGLSGHLLTATSRATTATFGWRVIDFVLGDPKSDPDAANCKVKCMANAGRREPALEIGGSLGT
jgi:hypothetical protein